MIKYLCDRCGSDLMNEQRGGVIEYKSYDYSEVQGKRYLCASCLKELLIFMTPGTSIDQPKEKDTSIREVFFQGVHFYVIKNQVKNSCYGCCFIGKELVQFCQGQEFLKSTGINCQTEEIIFQRIEP